MVRQGSLERVYLESSKMNQPKTSDPSIAEVRGGEIDGSHNIQVTLDTLDPVIMYDVYQTPKRAKIGIEPICVRDLNWI